MMGYSPQQMGRMSLFQYAACIDGWNQKNAGDDVEPPTDEEFEVAKAAHGDV
jgi:hypothetical protein